MQLLQGNVYEIKYSLHSWEDENDSEREKNKCKCVFISKA